MASQNHQGSGGFDKLLDNNVPLIHEKIILFLDYETFKKCGDVCEAWRDLLTSEAMQKKAKLVYFQEMKIENEKKLLEFSWSGRTYEVHRLLMNGVSPNYIDKGGRTAIWYARRNNNKKVVKMLLSAGANPHYMNLPDHCRLGMQCNGYTSVMHWCQNCEYSG